MRRHSPGWRIAALAATLLLPACGGGGGGSGSPPPAWGTPALVEASDESASAPQVAWSGQGDAFAIWQQFDGMRVNLFAARFVPATGWETAEPVEAYDGGDAILPRLGADGSGHAIAIWQQFTLPAGFNVAANRFDPMTGWGTAQVLQADTDQDGSSPRLTVAPGGAAWAVWQQFDGALISIRAARFSGTSWEADADIDGTDAESALFPDVGMTDSGIAMAVWQQFDGSRFNIVARRFDGMSWETPVEIEASDEPSTQARVAVAPDGRAFAVWLQFDGQRENVWAARFNGSAWEAPELIDSEDLGNVSGPRIGVDSSGNAVAAWFQNQGSRDDVWAARFADGSGWDPAERIESEDTGSAYNVELAVSPNGAAFAVWQQTQGMRDDIWANRFVPGTGWGTAGPIESDEIQTASVPYPAADASGRALAAWQQFDGMRLNVWFNLFN